MGQEWGRRRSDNQPYPKTRDKDVLPTGLRVVEGRISRKEGELWKVRSSVGHAIVGRTSDDESPVPMTLNIEHLEIDEELRGKGAGRVLVKSVEAHAQRFGFNAIILSSHPDAVGFWEKMGYQRLKGGGYRFKEDDILPPMIKHLER